MELREYQLKEVEAVFNSFREGNNALIVAATGTGKTITLSEVTKRLVADHKKVLILAHRSELLSQTQEKLLRFGVMSSLEKAQNTATVYDNVVVASIQSLAKPERLNRFEPDHFDVIIVDECHHIMSDTYQRTIGYFSNALILGVTATPNRSDMKPLSKIFPEISFSYNTRDAIDDGYLVPINIKRCPIKIDLSDVRTSAGDYLASDLDKVLDPYIDKIGDALNENAAGKKTLIFTPTVSIADKVANILKDKGFSAASVSSKSKNRDEIREKFATGEIMVAVNPLIWTEGFDEPTVECIVNLRATKSRSLFQQILGRGLRLSPGKESLLYLDFLWNSAKKDKQVLNPATLLIDEKDSAFLKDKDLDKEIDVFDLEEKLIERRLKAEEKLAEDLKKAARNRFLPYGVRFTEIENEHLSYFYEEDGDSLWLTSLVYKDDPFIKFITGKDSFEWVPYNRSDCDPATSRQLETLRNLGFAHPEIIQFKGQASEIINAAINRRKKNLCSFKQFTLLDKRGFKNVRNWTPAQCGYVIDSMAKNKWKVPSKFYPIQFYKPKKEDQQ